VSSPLRAGYDPTHYPVEDDVGESLLQRNLTEELRTNITSLVAERGEVMLVGASQFIYYRQFRPTDAVAPDVYVIPGVSPDTPVTAWKVWERDGLVPSFALEVVSTDVWKDYEVSPRRYAELGVPELVVFDPEYRTRRDRVRWQLFRRVEGEFVLVETTDEDRVRSKVLGCWLRTVGEGSACRVRLARDPRGDVLVPTPVEAEQAAKEAERVRREAAERAAKEVERTAKKAERAAKEAERSERVRREAAEAELTALRDEVERLRRGS
jgi:hypothetical protein